MVGLIDSRRRGNDPVSNQGQYDVMPVHELFYF